jgi:nitrite reductase (NO-forming)
MKHSLLPVLIAASLLALPGCAPSQKDTATEAVAATTDTGGSAKGDFGPPQGEPIKAVLTAAHRPK